MSKTIAKDINKALNSDMTKDFLDYLVTSFSPVPTSNNKSKYMYIIGIIIVIVIITLLIFYLRSKPDDKKT